jgi:hypothetical protein
MKKSTLLTSLAALLLSACACFEPSAPPPTHPVVSVISGTTPVVVPDPLYFSGKYKGHDTKIVWRLAAGESYRFARSGIVVMNGDGEILCGDERGEQQKATDGGTGAGLGRSPDGLEFTCLNRYTKEGAYKYTIRIDGPGGALPPLDPAIVNGR